MFPRGPFPTFDMAIRERQIASLPVAISGQITPDIAELSSGRRDAKMGVGNTILVNIQKHEQLAGRRRDDFRNLSKIRNDIPGRITVQGAAHAVAASADLVELYSPRPLNLGAVSRTMMDQDRTMVWE